MTLYEVLGVKQSASDREIRAAYRQLVMKHHPDVGGDPKTFITIQKAYEVLGNSAFRLAYDFSLKMGNHQPKPTRKLNIVLNGLKASRSNGYHAYLKQQDVVDALRSAAKFYGSADAESSINLLADCFSKFDFGEYIH